MARHRRIRPLSLALPIVLLAGVLFVSTGIASSAPELPPVAPEELVASVGEALKADPTVSGEVAVHVDLGLPALPDGTAPEVGALPVGDRRVRLWRSPDGVRVADLLRDGERSLVANRTEAWTWDAEAGTATHVTFPEDAPREHDDADERDPLTYAQRALDAIEPSTQVAVETTARVAGRDAYVLVLTPRSDDTLVGRVELAVDAERRLPLRYSVFARNTAEAPVEVAFTEVSYEAIDPATFDFDPPEGTQVTEKAAPDHAEHAKQHEAAQERGAGVDDDGREAATEDGDKRVFGESWDTVVAAPLDEAPPAELAQLLPYSGPLFSAELVEAGGRTWVVAGAVPASRLDAVAADLS